MLNKTVVAKSVGSLTAVTFVLCVAYGLVAPARFHAAWLLESFLPGFTWLTVGGFVLGLVETALYGAGLGLLYSVLYNYFARRSEEGTRAGASIVRTA
jgi:hypothetical protein